MGQVQRASCWRVEKALIDQGVAYQSVLGPGMPWQRKQRTRLHELTGAHLYPRGPEVGAWSPDGRRVVFERRGLEVDARSDQTDVFVMNAGGTDERPLTSDGASSRPSFSPDVGKIAFHRRIGGRHQRFVMNADGSGAVQLTADPAFSVSGTAAMWSPDGTRIAFTGASLAPGAANIAEIYTIGPDGSGLAQVTHDASTLFLGDCSPHGAWLLARRHVFVSAGSGDLTTYRDELVRGPSAGGDASLIVAPRDFEDVLGASWAPDGASIVFSMYQDDNLGAPEDAMSRLSSERDHGSPAFAAAHASEGRVDPFDGVAVGDHALDG